MTIREAPSPLVGGRPRAERKCSGCHAVEVTGCSANLQAPPFRNLYKRYPIEGLRLAFTAGIQVAHPKPRFRLRQSEIDALLEYLKILNPCSRPSLNKALW
jgi:cytochrome c